MHPRDSLPTPRDFQCGDLSAGFGISRDTMVLAGHLLLPFLKGVPRVPREATAWVPAQGQAGAWQDTPLTWFRPEHCS